MQKKPALFLFQIFKFNCYAGPVACRATRKQIENLQNMFPSCIISSRMTFRIIKRAAYDTRVCTLKRCTLPSLNHLFDELKKGGGHPPVHLHGFILSTLPTFACYCDDIIKRKSLLHRVYYYYYYYYYPNTSTASSSFLFFFLFPNVFR